MPRTATLESEPAQGLSACDETYPHSAGQFDWRSEQAERDAEPAEQDRLERRQRIRRRMAVAEMETSRLQPLVDRVRGHDAAIDAAADRHRETCEPLQRELEQLEKAAVNRISNRQPPDSKADARRAEILRQIGQANLELERTIRDERELKAAAENELNCRRIKIEAPSTIAIELTWPDAANPALLCELHAAKQSVKWADHRLDHAREFVAKLRSHLEKSGPRMTPSDRLDAERQLSRWQAELSAAENALTAATAECRRLHREILDE